MGKKIKGKEKKIFQWMVGTVEKFEFEYEGIILNLF